MRNGFLAVAVFVVVALPVSANAGPFRRNVTTTRASSCTGGNCSSASSRTVTRGGGAQSHAESMAASGSMVHAASHPGYEGVGVGGSPAAALASCCNNGGQVLDEGTAQGRDGRWYAVRRYSQR